MILLKREIINNIINKKIFVNKNINQLYIGPNSIDVTLSNVIGTYIKMQQIGLFILPVKFINTLSKKEKKILKNINTNNINLYKDFINKKILFNKKYLETLNIFLNINTPNKLYKLKIKEEFILLPNTLYLGATNEKIGSKYFIPMYEGRSSLARIGLQSHLSAGFGDIGFQNNWTLEIKVSHPTILKPNIRIGQVYFVKVNEKCIKNNFYNGKYKNFNFVKESEIYKDLEKKGLI